MSGGFLVSEDFRNNSPFVIVRSLSLPIQHSDSCVPSLLLGSQFLLVISLTVSFAFSCLAILFSNGP